MDRLQILEQQAEKAASDPWAVIFIRMTQGGLCEKGAPDIPVDWDKALDYYSKAAKLDSPEGYLGISRILRLISLTTEDDKIGVKREYADTARAICDPQTVKRLGWPEIALNIAVMCELLAESFAGNYCPKKYVDEYNGYAAQYYALGGDMDDMHKNDSLALCEDALAKLQKRGYGKNERPARTQKPEEPHP